jgi:hypothetical protein
MAAHIIYYAWVWSVVTSHRLFNDSLDSKPQSDNSTDDDNNNNNNNIIINCGITPASLVTSNHSSVHCVTSIIIAEHLKECTCCGFIYEIVSNTYA